MLQQENENTTFKCYSNSREGGWVIKKPLFIVLLLTLKTFLFSQKYTLKCSLQ